MTLKRFETLLRDINPRLRVRQRGYGDVGGLFVGLSGKTGYIARFTKGELTLHGYRTEIVDPTNPLHYKQGVIKKRGRKTLLMLLRNYRWVENHKDRSRILWGLKS